MNTNVSFWFLCLVLIQALHSVEEYIGKLWLVFPPATWLTGLISHDHHKGFLIINIGLFVIGLFVWFTSVRRKKKGWRFFVWFWIILELTNGLGHSFWSLYQGGYTPGLITATMLFVTAMYLLKSVLLTPVNH